MPADIELVLHLDEDVAIPRRQLSFRYAMGADWRAGWPEITPGSGGLVVNNEEAEGDHRPAQWTLYANEREDTLATGWIEPLRTLAERDGSDRSQARLYSRNRDLFGKRAQWSQTGEAGAGAGFVLGEILSDNGLTRGSIALGTQPFGVGGYDGTLRGLLSEIGRVVGAVVCESHLGSVSAVSAGHGVALGRYPHRAERAFDTVKEATEDAYNILRVERQVLPDTTQIVPLAFVTGERIFPGESVIVTAEADSRNLVDARWVDPAWPAGITSRVISRDVYSYTAELTNTTDDVVNIEGTEVLGDAIFSRVESSTEVRNAASVSERGEELRLEVRPWFSDGAEAYARFFVDDMSADGLDVLTVSLNLDLQSKVALLRPADILLWGNREWTVFRVAYDIAPAGLAQVELQALGLPTEAIGSRWGRGRWGASQWQ